MNSGGPDQRVTLPERATHCRMDGWPEPITGRIALLLGPQNGETGQSITAVQSPQLANGRLGKNSAVSQAIRQRRTTTILSSLVADTNTPTPIASSTHPPGSGTPAASALGPFS